MSTLKHDSIRDDLLNFYNKNYSANQMKLVLYSDRNIETLEQIATTHFRNVKNNNVKQPIYNEIPFDQSNMKQLWKVVPINNTN